MGHSHPTQPDYLSSFQKCWDECVSAAKKSDLFTWPDYPLRYVFTPNYFEDAAPYLYFLPYRSPPAFEKITQYDYLVSPIYPTMSQDEQERRLSATNYAVIKLNYVVHHGSVGHHLQNYHAYRAESRIGRIAAVDCASRIAMFCAGTMAEGWANYSTDLMGEVGFYNPQEQFDELHSHLRQSARALVDSRLHTGQITFDEAVQFYVNEVGMGEDAARSEVVKNSMFPATAAMYVLGLDTIHKLRDEMTKRNGATFNLRNFHDRFLKYGSIPVSVIAQSMLGHPLSLLS
jgi:hypothetical protein